jgi:hypothetical protein
MNLWVIDKIMQFAQQAASTHHAALLVRQLDGQQKYIVSDQTNFPM